MARMGRNWKHRRW